MLFTSIAATATKKTLSDALAWANSARKQAAEKRLSYYSDEQSAYILEQLQAQFTDVTKFQIAFLNIVKKIINNLATTYLTPPIREIDGTDRDKQIYRDIIDGSNFIPKMKLASRYTKLLKTILIRPVWRKGRIDFDILTPDILDVKVGETPEDLLSVCITHFSENGKRDEITQSLWTADYIRKLDVNGNDIEQPQANPYGCCLPFVPMWDRCPTSEFWQTGGDDLITLQDAINSKLVDLLYVIRLQGFGQPVIKGLLEAGNIKTGPGCAIELQAGNESDFYYAKTNAPIDAILRSIEFLIMQAAVSNGLSSASMTVKPTQESGIAKIVGSQELKEQRLDAVDLFRGYEKQLFELIKVVWNTHNPGRRFSKDCTLNLDFAEPKQPVSADKQAEAWERQIAMGVLSPVDILMEKNPDLTGREEALQRLIQIKNEKDQLSPSQGVKLED